MKIAEYNVHKGNIHSGVYKVSKLIIKGTGVIFFQWLSYDAMT